MLSRRHEYYISTQNSKREEKFSKDAKKNYVDDGDSCYFIG
jgi:hypothetical protein